MKGASDYPYSSPPEARAWQPHLPWEQNGAPLAADDVDLPDGFPLLAPGLAIVVAIVVGALSLGNVTMGPVGHSIRPGPGFAYGLAYFFAVLGSIGAQAAAITILLVFAQGPLWMRLAWHWVLALVILFTWGLGFAFAESDWVFTSANFPDEEFLALVMGLPLVSLICQAPLWLFRLYFGWRIERPDEEWPPARRRLAISDFVVGTVLAAVTMALLRMGKPANMGQSDYWAAWSIGSALIAGNSLLCVLPIVYFTLGVRRVLWSIVGVVGMIVAAATLSSTTLMIIARYSQGGAPTDREVILVMTSLAVSSAGLLATTLWIARASGYRLWIKSYSSYAEPAGWPASTPRTRP